MLLLISQLEDQIQNMNQLGANTKLDQQPTSTALAIQSPKQALAQKAPFA